MTLKPEQIQKINDIYLETRSIQKTSKRTRKARNTVKKYLRQTGILSYSYFSLTHTGPPSLYHQTSKWTPAEQQWINDLLNKVQMGYSQGGNLIKELDKTNQEKEQKDREISDLIQKNTNLTKEVKNVNKEKQDLKEKLDQHNIKIRELQQKVTQVFAEKETEKKEKEERQKKIDEQYERMITTERELAGEKSKNVKLEEKNKTIQKDHHERIQTLEADFSMMNNALNDSEKMNTMSKQKVTQLENEVRELKEKSKNSFIDGLIVGGLGVGAVAISVGLVAYQNYPPPLSYSNSPVHVGYGKNTGNR